RRQLRANLAHDLPNVPPASVPTRAVWLREETVSANAGREPAGDRLLEESGVDRPLWRSGNPRTDPAVARTGRRRVPARAVRGRRWRGRVGRGRLAHRPLR